MRSVTYTDSGVLDKPGRCRQFLPPQIQQPRPDMVVIGRAILVLSVDVFVEKLEGTTLSWRNASA